MNGNLPSHRRIMASSVVHVENEFIAMRDGARLAMRVWRPAAPGRVPALLEYIPYRKRDFTRLRDSRMHGYFAAHGFASCRVDMRGSGDSDGVLLDEYAAQELADGLDAIRAIASMPWCSGRVGMIGKSWGGFNGLQLAALQPPELGAVVSVCSTDDRYADDIHTLGGCQLLEHHLWASTMLAYNARPPDPELRPDDWRTVWEQRVRTCGFWLEQWLQHPSRDAFWRHGSVCEDWPRLQTPLFLVGGWRDGYTEPIHRIMASAPGVVAAPTALVGPYGHVYPHDADVEATGFLQECVAFFDAHLRKPAAPGPVAPPRGYRAWMFRPPPSEPGSGAHVQSDTGWWIWEPRWPPPAQQPRTFALCGRAGRCAVLRLESEPASTAHCGDGDDAAAWVVTAPASLEQGLGAGDWYSYGVAGDAPGEQREDDARGLCWDSEPLAEDLALLGSATLRVRVRAHAAAAQLCARLCDVAPPTAATPAAAASSRRVSYALISLAHHAAGTPESPQPAGPECWLDVTLRLRVAAHVFAAGHRVRLVLSSNYWPIAWPATASGGAATPLDVDGASVRLTLPESVHHRTAASSAAYASARATDPPFGRHFRLPECAPADAHSGLGGAATARRWLRGDLACPAATRELWRDETGGVAGSASRLTWLHEPGCVIGHDTTQRLSWRGDGDPLSTSQTIWQHLTVAALQPSPASAAVADDGEPAPRPLPLARSARAAWRELERDGGAAAEPLEKQDDEEDAGDAIPAPTGHRWARAARIRARSVMAPSADGAAWELEWAVHVDEPLEEAGESRPAVRVGGRARVPRVLQ